MAEDHIALRELAQKLVLLSRFRDSTTQGRARIVEFVEKRKARS